MHNMYVVHTLHSTPHLRTYHCACTSGGCLRAPVENRLHALLMDHIGAGLTLTGLGTEPPGRKHNISMYLRSSRCRCTSTGVMFKVTNHTHLTHTRWLAYVRTSYVRTHVHTCLEPHCSPEHLLAVSAVGGFPEVLFDKLVSTELRSLGLPERSPPPSQRSGELVLFQ